MREIYEKIGPEHIIYRVNTVLGLAEAVAANIGLGLLPCFIGDKTPGIRRISTPIRALDANLWLLTHPDLRDSARVRAFMTYAGTELSKQKKMIEGLLEPVYPAS